MMTCGRHDDHVCALLSREAQDRLHNIAADQLDLGAGFSRESAMHNGRLIPDVDEPDCWWRNSETY